MNEALEQEPAAGADQPRRRASELCNPMALNDLERKRAEKALASFMQKRRPPVHVRSQLDFGYRLEGQSVELFEIRPKWNEPSQKLERPFAKATYVRARETWKVYWLRADLKWHVYEPAPQVGSLEKFLQLVAEDRYACFFG